MNPGKLIGPLLAWFQSNGRDLPWRRTRDPYAVWVSEIMLQQTRVKKVLPYWERWMGALPDIRAVALAKPETLDKLWEGLGYYTRVRNLQQAARLVVERHGGRFPEGFEQVLALPGIGRYTAGAVCSIAFDQPRPVLDGNVIRVLTRLYGIAGDPRQGATNALLWRLAEGLTRRAWRMGTPGSCSRFNQALMELGALLCTARQPRCGACPVARCCAARRRGLVERLPHKARRPRPVRRRFAAFVVRQRGRFLVRQRPDGVVNARLWEFPNVELRPGNADLGQAAQDVLGSKPVRLEPLCALSHTITSNRIRLEAFRVERRRPGCFPASGGRWLTRGQLARLPFAGGHRTLRARLKAEG